jgi:hypothetical protein
MVNTPGEALIEQFSITLNLSEIPHSRTGTAAQGRARRSSQDSQHQDFSGIQGLPALQKLHGLSRWLQNHSTHSDHWDDAVRLRLGIDNKTRWSSWYLVIDRALRKKPQIVQFMTDYETTLDEHRITGQDWDILQKAHQFLQPFAAATLYAEGDKSSISQSLVLMDALLLHYEQQKVRGMPD